MLPGRVLHLVDDDVGMVDGHALDGREAEAEELARHPEHPLPQLVELQVGLHRVLVEVVLRLADLLGVVAIVPRGDPDPGALLVGDRLHVGDLLVDAGHRRRPDRLQERHGPGRGLRHRVLEPPVGVGLVAEQLRPLGAQGQDLGDDGVVVLRVAVVATVHEGTPGLLPQVAPARVGQEGLDARPRVEDCPLPLLPAGLGGGGRRRAEGVREPGQVLLALEEQDVVVLVGEDVLAELRAEAGEALVDLGDALLGLGREGRAGADEVGVVEPGETLLLGGEAGRLPRGVHGGDPLEELRVLGDPVAEGGELRRHLRLDGLELGGVHRRAPDAVDVDHLLEDAVGALERGDRVLEGGRGGAPR